MSRDTADRFDATTRAGSQTVKALLALRELILAGDLPTGERISELAIVDRLGVSRTPVRVALVRLAEEGLLEEIPSGGFSVKGFTEKDAFDAIELRGVLEGMAARLAAERSLAHRELDPIRDCLEQLDSLLADDQPAEDMFSNYARLNGRFHELLRALSGSGVLIRQLERTAALPFASHNGFVIAQSVLPEARTMLWIAQDQHRCVIDAIDRREGGRAEALMREHARVASRNLRLTLRDTESRALVPGGALIRRAV